MTRHALHAIGCGLGHLLGSWTVASLISVAMYFAGANWVSAILLPLAFIGWGRSITDAWGVFAKALHKENEE